MITLDELINLTYATVSTKSKIELETVVKILSEVGIAGLMDRETVIDTPHRLLVRQVLIRGAKQELDELEAEIINYRRYLKPGLNGWIAGNGTGKSTVLKTIIWALSGVKPNFKPDILPWLSDVAVELEITNDGIYTILYSLRKQKPHVTGSIFPYELNTILDSGEVIQPIVRFSGSQSMTEEISRFFGSRLGFLPLEAVQWQSYSLDPEHMTVSWDVYSQALFIGADNYSDFLFPQGNTKINVHHQKALSMYLGFDLTEAVSRVQAKYEEARRELAFEQKRVQVNAAEVYQKIEQVQEQLRQIERQKEAIDQNRSALIDPMYVQVVQERVAACTDKFLDLGTAKEELLSQERRIKSDLDRAKRTIHYLDELIAFKVSLSHIRVEKCPHCDNDIPTVSVEEELNSGQCHVCHGPVHFTSDVDQQKQLLEAAKKRAVKLRKEVREVGRTIEKIGDELEIVHAELQKHRAEFSDLSRQQREGFTQEMRNLLDQGGYLRGLLEQLSTQTEESQSQRLAEVKTRAEVLREAISHLQSKIQRGYEDILKKLQEDTTSLAKAFGVPHLEQVFFNKAFDMFVKQSGHTIRFLDMDTGERLRLKIAFQLALLMQRVEAGVGRHPAFLIVDAPGSAEMDEQYLSAITNGFADIENRFGDQVQILIASSKDELLDMFSEEKVENKLEGEFIF